MLSYNSLAIIFIIEHPVLKKNSSFVHEKACFHGKAGCHSFIVGKDGIFSAFARLFFCSKASLYKDFN